MDAKQACDKLNGFNFQNRYLVGNTSTISSAAARWRGTTFANALRSSVSPAGENGEVERGPGGATGESGEIEEAAWD